MGYKPKRTLYKLTFDDPDFEGLEVVTKGVSVEGLKKFAEMFETVQGLSLDAGAEDQSLKPEHLKLLDEFFASFAKVLVSWNVENDDDTPVPTTVTGLQSQELDFVMKVIESWITGMVQAPPPLPGSSSDGMTSPEESTLGLAGASKSLAS